MCVKTDGKKTSAVIKDANRPLLDEVTALPEAGMGRIHPSFSCPAKQDTTPPTPPFLGAYSLIELTTMLLIT